MFLFNPRELIHGVEAGDPKSLASVFFLLIFNEVGLPLPIVYETLLLYTGYKLSRGNPGYIPTAVFGAFGSAVGASLVFMFFYIFGESLLGSKFFVKHMEKVGVLKKELHKRAILAVTLGRLTPGLVGLTGVAAGILRINYLKFVAGVLVSNLVWAAVMVTAGFFFGETSERFSGRITAIIGFVSLAIFLLVVKKVLAKLKQLA